MPRSSAVNVRKSGSETGGRIAVAQPNALGDVRGDRCGDHVVRLSRFAVMMQEAQIGADRVRRRLQRGFRRRSLRGAAEQIQHVDHRFPPPRPRFEVQSIFRHGNSPAFGHRWMFCSANANTRSCARARCRRLPGVRAARRATRFPWVLTSRQRTAALQRGRPTDHVWPGCTGSESVHSARIGAGEDYPADTRRGAGTSGLPAAPIRG